MVSGQYTGAANENLRSWTPEPLASLLAVLRIQLIVIFLQICGWINWKQGVT